MTQNLYQKLDLPEIRAVMFYPHREETPLPPGALDFTIPVAEGVEIGARFHPAGPEAENILFFHGNGETIYDYDTVGPLYNRAGLGFLAVDYRGYGKSSGYPAASTMLADAHLILKKVQELLVEKNLNSTLIVMGRSLGSASAIELMAAYQEQIAGLIIESGFSTTLPLLLRFGIDIAGLGIQETDGFKNLQKIQTITKPTLIIHAQKDEIIPVQDASLLQVECAARHKEFQIVPGADHNSIMACAGRQYFEVIRIFVDKVTKKRGRKKYRNAPE